MKTKITLLIVISFTSLFTFAQEAELDNLYRSIEFSYGNRAYFDIPENKNEFSINNKFLLTKYIFLKGQYSYNSITIKHQGNDLLKLEEIEGNYGLGVRYPFEFNTQNYDIFAYYDFLKGKAHSKVLSSLVPSTYNYSVAYRGNEFGFGYSALSNPTPVFGQLTLLARKYFNDEFNEETDYEWSIKSDFGYSTRYITYKLITEMTILELEPMIGAAIIFNL